MLATISALPGVPGIFIENIQSDLGSGKVEVRLGYFGISSSHFLIGAICLTMLKEHVFDGLAQMPI